MSLLLLFRPRTVTTSNNNGGSGGRSGSVGGGERIRLYRLKANTPAEKPRVSAKARVEATTSGAGLREILRFEGGNIPIVPWAELTPDELAIIQGDYLAISYPVTITPQLPEDRFHLVSEMYLSELQKQDEEDLMILVLSLKKRS